MSNYLVTYSFFKLHNDFPDRDADIWQVIKNGMGFCVTYSEESAISIVRAVNSYDKFVDLLHESANLIANIKLAGANYPLVKRIAQAIAEAEGKYS